jgi:hypothetical protein
MVMNAKQLEEKAEEDLDFDEDDFMKEYREKRMLQMKEENKLSHFGAVIEIDKQSWEQHVTRAPQDCNVVIHLYQE